MGLPKAVQEQVEFADQFVERMNGQQTANDAETDGQQEQQIEQPQPVSQENVNPEPEKWAHKYHTLKGMYDAEVPRLHSEVKELRQQLQELLSKPQPAPAPIEPTKEASLITDHDREAFGADLIDLIERATSQKVAKFEQRESKLLEQIDQLKSKLGEVSEVSTKSVDEIYWDRLSKLEPEWEQINVDPKFLSWLEEVDSVYGLPRKAALDNAHNARSAERVAKIMQTFKGMRPPKPASDKNGLAKMVAPTRSRNGAAPQDTSEGNQRIYSQQEIAQFFNDYRRGMYTSEEGAKMESEITAAVAEGRVR